MMLETVLRGVFDYAGMFPPASLSLHEALHASARFPQELHRWDLVGNDMVVRLDDLGDLDDRALREAGFTRPCRTCVVGVAESRAEEAVDVVTTIQSMGGNVRISSLEVELDSPMDAQVASWRDQLLGAHVRLYVEPAWTDAQWGQRKPELWSLLAGLKDSGPAVGLKFRAAGPRELSHRTMAELVAAVNQMEVPLKATQGLHHPVMGEGPERRHGFLNLLVALRLQHALGLPGSTVQSILETTDASDFGFDGLAWRDHRAMAQRVMEAAAAVPFSIGSCSLEEPDQDLQDMFGPF